MNTLKMKLQETPFNQIKEGIKTVEIRLNDEKRRQLSVGDIIEFSLFSNDSSVIRVKVKGLMRFESFASLFSSDIKQKTGFLAESISEATEKMYAYYSAEDESLYGVLAIEFTICNQ